MAKSLSAILEAYEAKRESLIPILHDVNDAHGFVSEKAMQAIADYLTVSPTEVYGTATFYHFFNTKQKGTYVIRVCQSISCDLAGKDAIIRALEKELKIPVGGTTKNGRFTLEKTNCIGMCDQGPAMLVNKKVYTKLTPQKIKKIIAELKKKGGKK